MPRPLLLLPHKFPNFLLNIPSDITKYLTGMSYPEVVDPTSKYLIDLTDYYRQLLIPVPLYDLPDLL